MSLESVQYHQRHPHPAPHGRCYRSIWSSNKQADSQLLAHSCSSAEGRLLYLPIWTCELTDSHPNSLHLDELQALFTLPRCKAIPYTDAGKFMCCCISSLACITRPPVSHVFRLAGRGRTAEDGDGRNDRTELVNGWRQGHYMPVLYPSTMCRFPLLYDLLQRDDISEREWDQERLWVPPSSLNAITFGCFLSLYLYDQVCFKRLLPRVKRPMTNKQCVAVLPV